MTIRLVTRWLAALAGAAVLPTVTQGAILTFAFDGHVDVVDDRHGLLTFIHVGDPVTYIFSFDSDAPDAYPHPNAGDYQGLSASLRVNDTSLQCTPPRITIAHPNDYFNLDSTVNIDWPGLEPEGFVYFCLSDQAQSNALTDAALPLVPYDLTPFASREFSATLILPPPAYSQSVSFWGHIDRFYAVPEPTTLAMLALALLTLRPRSQ